MHELLRAVSHCPTGPVRSTVQGAGLMRERIRVIDNTHLLPGALALRVHYARRISGRTVGATVVAVYQKSGDLLSGVYTARGAVGAQVRVALGASRESAGISSETLARRASRPARFQEEIITWALLPTTPLRARSVSAAIRRTPS